MTSLSPKVTAKETGEACVFYLLMSCFFVVMAFHMLKLTGFEVFKYVKGKFK